jgi:hypothetical protein
MFQKFDLETAQEFLISTGMLMSIEPERSLPQRPATVIFSCGLRNDVAEHRGALMEARRRGMDIIRMEFDPGQESRGPVNTVVYERQGRKLQVWKECILWVHERGGPVVMVPTKAEYGFVYDATDLVRIDRGKIGPAELMAGAARAMAMLRRAVLLTPSKLAKTRVLWTEDNSAPH